MATIEVERWWGNTPAAQGSGRALLVLPGMNYPVDGAGIMLPVRALAEQGWEVFAVAWDLADVREDPQALRQAVEQAAEQAHQAAGGATTMMLLGKSVASLATGWVARAAMPAIWLTPMLTRPEVCGALAASPAPALLAGGSADQLWDGAAARATGKQVLELGAVDHGFISPSGDPAYLATMTRLTAACTDFAASLG
ncbi:hypothetical protein [Luteococcus peritonei]|uniref:Alpha/beta hydrolase n=1 Tax=Luteococcus peritonei TaxID=88874 RepID=A0ABW4RU04_9ACTN